MAVLSQFTNAMSAVCTRPSCRKPFNPARPEDNVCEFHPGAPLFHEGLKSWTCCASYNKPVLSFDDFEKIKGCAIGQHTLEAPAPARPANSATVDNAAASLAKASLNGSAPSESPVKSILVPPRPERTVVNALNETPPLLDDPPDAVPVAGASCKRTACKTVFSDGILRSDEECVHHPREPVFHEGSKGYACCKRRVLDFQDFLAIEGCTRGRHVFVGRPPTEAASASTAPPRTDHYQTPTSVVASIFLKNVDAGQSTFQFTHWTLSYVLVTKSATRAAHTIDLFGPIDPDKSSHRVLGTKVEITLWKADGRSWPTLEMGDESASNRGSQYTFGVGDRGGTVGAKKHTLNPVS